MSAHGAFWINGTVSHAADAPALAADRGFLLGDGLYETLLIRRGAPVLLEAHLARLRRSAEALGFPLPADLTGAVRAALADLREAISATEEMALRITLTRGPGQRGLDPPPQPHPTLVLWVTPHHPDAPARRSAWVIDRPRIDPADLLAGHKSTSALRAVLARQAARANGAEVALLRTLEGDVAEADSANLFAVIEGRVVTPPLSRGILPGVTRAFVLDALTAGAATEERPLAREELGAASELFLTSSVAGVSPLLRLDWQPLPAATPVADWVRGRYGRLEGE